MRIVFFGTPEFAIPTLEALARAHEVALVVAQPDRPAGRGLKLHSPAIAVKAKEQRLPLAQPARIRDVLDDIAAIKPDVGIIVAYGKILPAWLLQIPRFGFVNVHASILPKYRGAAPIQRAIEHGERETGISIMHVDQELDHGPLFHIEKTSISPDEHAPNLGARLSRMGAEALLRTLEAMQSGTARQTPQDHARATYAPKIEKHEGEIRWNETAVAIYNKFRAFDPWPGIFTGDLKLMEIKPASESGVPGTIVSMDARGVIVAASGGAIRLIAVQRAGKSQQRAADFAHGAGWRVGARIS